MVAAAGNRVEALHRSAFGAPVLPADLAPGPLAMVEGAGAGPAAAAAIIRRMRVFRGFHHPGIAPACALTIGNFDGVHAATRPCWRWCATRRSTAGSRPA